MSSPAARDRASRSRDLLGRKLRAVADRDRDRARRRDDQRHLRPHRHDQGGVRRRSSRRSTRTPTPSSRGKSAIGGNANDGVTPPSLPESLLAKVRGAARRRRGRGRHRRPGEARRPQQQGDLDAAARRASRSASTRRATSASTRSSLTAGHWPNGPDEIAIDANDRERASTSRSATRSACSTRGPVAAVPHRRASCKLRRRDSLGGATMAIFDLPTAQRIFRQGGPARLDRRRGEAGVTPDAARRADPADPAGRPRRCATGQQQAKQAAKDTNGFLSILEYFLLAFGVIALFVGSFVIANTLVDHDRAADARARDAAHARRDAAAGLLRRSSLEALVIGVLASVDRALPRARAREGAERALRRVRDRPADRPGPCSRRGRSSSALARRASSSR